MKIFTSEEVLRDPWHVQEEMSRAGKVYYEMTNGELGWLDFVRGRYAIADYLDECFVAEQSDVVRIEDDFSATLDADCRGAGKAVCLSKDSALQAIFFYCYEEDQE